MRRWSWVIGILVVAAAGIYWGMRPQAVPVETAVVAAKPLQVVVEEEGKTRLRKRYVVSAPVAGFTRRLPWKAGDIVKAGQVIAQLEAAQPMVLDVRTRDQAAARVKVTEGSLAVAEARLATQQEQVRAAQADHSYWKKQLEREEVLRRSGDLAVAQMEKTQAEVRRAEANVAAAERTLTMARAEIGTAKAEIVAAQTALRSSANRGGQETVAVVAPVGGRVIRLLRESEGVVGAGEGLVEIGDANAIEVVAEVLSADAVKIVPGMRVLLSRWGGEGTLDARVRVVEPGGFTKISALGVEEQRVRVVADITSPEEKWQRLGDGYRVEAAFVLWEGESVMQVPANTLFRWQEGWAVFVQAAGVARRKPVQVGHRSGTAAEIVSGLSAGEVVIQHPDDTIAEGALVLAEEKK